MDVKTLHALKRAELQKLAKQRGIRANRKNAEIIEELLQIVSQDEEKAARESNIENITQDSRDKQETENEVQTSTEKEQKEKVTQIPKKIPVAKGKSRINWQEIHNRSFGKMESIDAYIQRKKDRADQFKSSLKSVAKDARTALSQMQNTHNTPKALKENNTDTKSIASTISAIKSPFRPPSTLKKPNKFIFNTRPSYSNSEATKKDGNKLQMRNSKTITTPLQRQSINISKINSRTSSIQRPRKISHQPTPCLDFRSPFSREPQLNVTLTLSGKKFDLKESLKKPLPYKPHYGKLKGFTETYIEKEDKAKRRTEVKNTRKAQTRSDRRAVAAGNRKDLKNKSLNRRRGIANIN